MPGFSIDSFLLVRSPAYSYRNFSTDHLKQVIKTDFFKAALFFGSKTLYLELQKNHFEYEGLSDGLRTTLWKYLNRMCYRPLPYGLFSSFAQGAFHDAATHDLFFERGDELIINPDFKVVTDHLACIDQSMLPELIYHTNNTIYRSPGQLRFISRNFTQDHQFAVLELQIVPGLMKLLKFVAQGQTREAVLKYLKLKYGDDAPAEAYFQSLVAQQVILSSLLPNVTGENYHQRCLSLLKTYPDTASLLASHRIRMDNPVQQLPGVSHYIAELCARPVENPAYALYQRKLSGGISAQVKAELIRLVGDLDKLTHTPKLPGLEQFKQDFSAKYDQQEIPLLQVLDPGSGIGYENLASSFDPENDSFIEDLKVAASPLETINWNPVTRLLFKKWNSLAAAREGVITLTEEDLKHLPASEDRLPPGMAVLFKLVDNEIWLDSIAGVSGLEILGRFAASGSDIEERLQFIAKQQGLVNSNYVFAEIAFSTHDRAANINQRGHFFTYEIPILTHSTLPLDRVIGLDDIRVSVRNDRVLLKSVRLNKYILPRLSSAYNYRLNPIPVLRFLCDLQFQGVKANLSFGLPQLFPGLDYYPRLQLRHTVLSPATWILNEAQLQQIRSEGLSALQALGLSRHFCLVEGDNFLVFNQGQPDDMAVLGSCLKGKKTATLTEYVLTRDAALQDIDGKPYAAQLVACLLNQSQSYDLPFQPVFHADQSRFKVKRDFLPGDEWLYLKLYLHPSWSDEVLLKVIGPLVSKYSRNYPNFKWFFIRYQDPGDHLRLRFLVTGRSFSELYLRLKESLEPYFAEGKAADLVLTTYRREIEKYSAGLIIDIESFFYQDSEFILAAFTNRGLNKSYKLSFGCFQHWL
jgi:hypothetical protein